ncbi:hypothetical protein EV379_3103 [Microterricola gilva]|uniref:Uncharacterized protein n=1 Tax=Microterricola gilva TaxID=393267 RepID=A0A4Q8AQ18_9MICO|nr:hypothetical protein [Microterricola gilva]RZU66737.1 hypothetical protein EV379_3103 [Microterricola gilva]
MSVDLTAPVDRFEVGQRVRWDYGDRPAYGAIEWMLPEDSIYVGSGDLVTPWGTYLGRLCFVRCDNSSCWCARGDAATGHYCNECQLTLDDRESAAVSLFDLEPSDSGQAHESQLVRTLP